jgi:hypothetical protein
VDIVQPRQDYVRVSNAFNGSQAYGPHVAGQGRLYACGSIFDDNTLSRLQAQLCRRVQKEVWGRLVSFHAVAV